tara:strand:- start:4396 stop:5307 length:912 start_codon:yes stop_codon:yes gene_type:complete
MVKKCVIALYLISLNALLLAQTDSTSSSVTSDSSSVITPSPSVEKGVNDYKTKGISVSPAHFHLNMKPGEVKTYKITIKNDTEKTEKFKVNTFDFNMDGKGKSSFISPGTGKYSLSKWLNVSPTFIEVAPGEKKEIKFTVNIPTDSTGNKAAWNIIMIEQEEPRKKLEPPSQSDQTIALGVIPTFAFGVFVYQNPPNVSSNSVEITNFSKVAKNDSVNFIQIEAKNTGNGIAYCTSYVDLTNLNTGKQQRLMVKRFTIVPELTRDFTFILPKGLEKGKYLAIGVLDYEGSEEIQAAKMEFEIN